MGVFRRIGIVNLFLLFIGLFLFVLRKMFGVV